MIDEYGNKYIPVDDLIKLLKSLPAGSLVMVDEVRSLRYWTKPCHEQFLLEIRDAETGD